LSATGQIHNYLFYYLTYAGILGLILVYMIIFMPEPKRVTPKGSNEEEMLISNEKAKNEKHKLFKNKN
jgi:hypothetical protein